MKILSFNMRGWGDSAKRRRLNSFIKSGAFDMCLLQETKRESFENFMIHNLWGHIDVEWVVKESRGLSGGMLIIWNKDLFNFRYSFNGGGFLGLCVEWKSGILYIVNVYSPCSLSGKRKLWNDLLEFKLNNEPGDWCLGGDFNSISKVGERRGRNGPGSQSERA
jgi:exonuclease III